MISEKEKLDFESLPEFVREPYAPARDTYAGGQQPSKPAPAEKRKPVLDDPDLPKSAELDTLWPGVNHDYFQPSRKSPSFYLTLGFMAGAIVSLVGVWGYFLVNGAVNPTTAAGPGDKKIVVAGDAGKQAATDRSNKAGHPVIVDGTEVLQPLYPTYEVKDGDTLAGIAYRAYKRVSPRLLDEICKANGMRNANVLSLGQKLALPVYRTQSSKIAGSGQLQ